MNFSTDGFTPEMLMKNVELLKYMMTPKNSYDIFEKMTKASELGIVILKMDRKLEEYILKFPNETEKIAEARNTIQVLNDTHRYIHVLFEAGSAKENHNSHLTPLTISLMAQLYEAKAEIKKLTDVQNYLNEEAA